LAVALSYAHNLGNFRTTDFKISNISVGGSLRVISENLQNVQANAANIDLGILMEIIEGLRLGVVAQNLGTTSTFISSADTSPVNTKLGLSWNFHFNDANRILLAYDVQHPIDSSNPNYNRWLQNIGGEYWLMNTLALRGGYDFGYDVGGLTAGAGFKWEDLGVDYAFVPYSMLGNSHRISLSYSFGSSISRPDVAAPNPPQGLKGVAYDRLVSLAWEAAPEKDVIGYNVYYSKTSGKDFVRTNEKPEPKQNSLNVRLSNDITYYFVITAVNAAGKESEYSDEIAMVPHAPEKPKAPQDVKAEVSGRTVTLTWTPMKDAKVVGYNVYFTRSAGQGYRKLTKATPLTDPECRLRGLTPDASYFFVVTAVTKDGQESEYSTEISAKPRQETLNEAAPSAPSAPGAKKKATPVNDEPF
jgi:fibronectin type 3 domain-containing protein